MNNNLFAELLLNVAFTAIICDGEIDDQEIETLENMGITDFYLNSLNIKSQLIQFKEKADLNLSKYQSNLMTQIFKSDIMPSQKIILLNYAIAIVRADRKMQESEIRFVDELILNLRLSKAQVQAIYGTWWKIDEVSENH